MSQRLRHVKVKICFPYSTIRALPVFWYIFPECPWGKAIVWQALPPAVPAGVPKGDLKNGNNYYQSKCGACHGGQAQGNSGLNTPALSMLNGIYLKQQFQSFQQGLRGTHPEDKYGRQMKMMSSSLRTDKDLDDVIAYIQSMAKPL